MVRKCDSQSQKEKKVNASSSDILWTVCILKEKAEKQRTGGRTPQVSGRWVWPKLGRGKEVVDQGRILSL